MNTLTVKDIKDRLQEVKDAQDPFIAQCENDPRKSVQTLVEQWLKKQAKEKALKEQWVNMTSYERLARNKGFRLMAGVDEVGQGHWQDQLSPAQSSFQRNVKYLD